MLLIPSLISVKRDLKWNAEAYIYICIYAHAGDVSNAAMTSEYNKLKDRLLQAAIGLKPRKALDILRGHYQHYTHSAAKRRRGHVHGRRYYTV